MPFVKMQNWLAEEKELGSKAPDNIILATATASGIPHSRVVAIREISPKGILFFTQRGKRKVIEMTENPHASMTLWLAHMQREVILDGIINPLTHEENQYYWNTLSRDRQLRFQELFELGGWSSFEMVLRYAHLSSNHLMKAAERISGVKMVERNLKLVII